MADQIKSKVTWIMFIPDEFNKPFLQIYFGPVKVIKFSSCPKIKALFVLRDPL